MYTSLQNKNAIEQEEQVKGNLHAIFQCLEAGFCPKITHASREFLDAEFYFTLAGISYTPSLQWKSNDYLVTQINLVRDVNLTLKISDSAASLILLNALGERQEKTDFLQLKDLSELEANILTSYNDFIYRHLNGLFLGPKEINSVLHTLQNEKTLYLTFYIHTKDEQEAGRIILSFPEFIFRKIEPITEPEQPLRADFFNGSIVETSILIGKTSAPLDDIKNLEPEDVIILEKSNLHTMYLREFEDISINMNPSSNLLVSFEEENGEDIVNEPKDINKSIWDNLEVDINACFEKVKMKLGDLREITEGLVVDVASVAENKVFIDVEGKQLAVGELVIIGDKYGVKITEIFSEAKSAEVEKLEERTIEVIRQPEEEAAYEETVEAEAEVDDVDDMEIDEDFDESDFDMDDDNNE